MRKERIAQAELKKQLFMQQLSANQSSVKHDHTYINDSHSPIPPQEIFAGETKVNVQQKLLDDLYTHHVSINATAIRKLESST